MRMQIYFSDEESNYVKSKGPGYVRGLIQQEMGGGTPEKHPKNGVCKKTLPEKIEIPIPPDKPVCGTCGMPLNKWGNCSNLTCKKGRVK